MLNRKVEISDIMDFVTASDSELSKLSEDDNNNEIKVPQNVLVSTVEVSSDEENEDEDDVLLANLANSSSGSNIKTANRVYQWQKHDHTFQGTFTEPPEEELIPLQYFKRFFKDEILNTIWKIQTYIVCKSLGHQ